MNASVIHPVPIVPNVMAMVGRMMSLDGEEGVRFYLG
jgi:hypothetical protein